MIIVLLVAMLGLYAAEAGRQPELAALGVDQTASALQPGGNMEGKEVRFGIASSALFATATTAASNGSVNSMHDSFTPLGGLVPLVMMQLGEVIFGGVGSGLYGMLAFVIVAVFVAGLMVGRTPEYLGKKIEVYEMKMASLLILIMPMVVLSLHGAGGRDRARGKAGPLNPGPTWLFSEILYAFSSHDQQQRQRLCRPERQHAVLQHLPAAWPCSSGASGWRCPPWRSPDRWPARRMVPAGAGTLPTHTPMFIAWLIAVVIVVGALNFMPALALGPIVEHLLLMS